MTCLALIGVDGWVCGPSESHFKPQNKSRVVWCFRCRARNRHWLVLIDQPWYDIEGIWICVECGGDHTSFPG